MLNSGSNSKQTATVSFLAAALMLAISTAGYAQSPVTPPGAGTQADPCQISELGHLVWMGDTTADSAGKCYSMTADIDASVTASWNDDGTGTDVLEGFKPIGSHSYPDTASFRGIFNGNGHTIANLVINRANTRYIGLFGSISVGGVVANLEMVGGAVTGGAECIGILAGENWYGTVSNCFATGVVNGGSYVGGLVGFNYFGTVSDCHAAGAVMGTSAVVGARRYIGGLVGSNFNGTVWNCHTTTMVTSSDCLCLGGLAGYNSGSVLNCRANSQVTGSLYVGGLVGRNEGSVSNCYALGTVAGMSGVGGLIGDNESDAVLNCYSACVVVGRAFGFATVGGLIGSSNYPVKNSFWDKPASGCSTSAYGKGKTTAEMKHQATFVGWDFSDIWGMTENVSYPYLRNLDVDSDGDGAPATQDCDDADPTVYSGATELSDGKDNDCDGYVDEGPGSVLARCVFYNNSFYDNNVDIDTAVGAKTDSAAIDTSKTPLMLGGGSATFANWTGYTKGINGLIYDLVVGTGVRDPQPSDFTFSSIGEYGYGYRRVDPSSSGLIVLQEVNPRIIRVVFTFKDYSVKNTWLQVHVGTGFGAPPELHFWGNVAGDANVGNTAENILVNAQDELTIKTHLTSALNRSPVIDPNDINKDSTNPVRHDR